LDLSPRLIRQIGKAQLEAPLLELRQAVGELRIGTFIK
jgi:hypothetical protein